MPPFLKRRNAARRRRRERAKSDLWDTALERRIALSLIGYTPAQITRAYGYDKVNFKVGGVAVPGDGRGQTVALFEVGDTPGLAQDLAIFDRAFQLPDLTTWFAGNPQPAGPFLRMIGFDGGDQIIPPTSTQSEAILDIEWLHAVAPAANILIVEAAQTSEIPDADAFAASQPGVVVVSNSYSNYDYLESPDEVGDDPSFTTPSGHPGVTFVNSSGDTGAPSHPPNFSPNVVAVGGTSLTLSADGDYGSETAWAGSGGGLSLYERLPSYQYRAVPRGVRRRAVPDVSILGNKITGVQVYNPNEGGWAVGGGTSLAAPLWAGIIAIADQGRSLRGLGSLDGPTQTLPDLYRLPGRDFHTITVGNNGFRAHRSYNLVTGLGSPYVNRVVSGLVVSTAVYRAPRPGKPLRPPPSYFANTPRILHATAGAAFSGILATMRFDIPSDLAAAVTATVDWGDGTALNSTPIDLNPIGAGIFQVRTVSNSPGRKVFAAPGNYRIHTTITLPSGSVIKIVRTIHVLPAPLTVSGQPLNLSVGTPVASVVATFTDAALNPDPTDPVAAAAFSARIKWGDGSTSSGKVAVRSTAPGFIVDGDHAYRTPGKKPIAVKILERISGARRPLSFVTRAIASVAAR
jgi:hypothetical protein